MPERYRVAIVTRTFPPRSGGIASAHYNLFKLLQSHHDLRAFAFDDDSDQPEPHAVRRKSSRAAALFLRKSIERYVRARDPGAAAVFCKSIASVVPGSHALSGPLADFKPDIVIVPDNYVPALGLRFPKDASVIWVSHHNYKRFENHPLVHRHSWMDIHLAHRLELRGLRKVHHVICPSRYMENVFRETYRLPLPVDVIYNFVHQETLEIAPANIRPTLGVSDDCRVIYIPSAGSAVKGKRYVFEIIRRIAARGNAAFYLSGNIDHDLAFELAALGPGVPVLAPGHLPYEEHLCNVAACDFAISPTLIENFSSAIVEGLMLSLPFMTFDTGGNKELIHSGINGFVVPYLDVEALLARSIDVIESPELLGTLRANASKTLKTMLDPDHLRIQYQTLFDQLRSTRKARN